MTSNIIMKFSFSLWGKQMFSFEECPWAIVGRALVVYTAPQDTSLCKLTEYKE